MKDIRTKECNRAPKLRNPVSRMPKELMRDALLKTKEKSHDISETYGSDRGQESPEGYADRKVETAEGRAIDISARAVSAAGRIMVKKSYEKIRGYRQEQPMAEDVRENEESCAGDSVNGNVKEKDSVKDRIKEKVREKRVQEKTDSQALSDEVRLSSRDMYNGKPFGDKESEPQKNRLGQTSPGADRIKTIISQKQAEKARNIKATKNQREIRYSCFKDNSRKSGKSIFHNTDDAILHVDKIRTGSVGMPGKQAIHTAVPKKDIAAVTPKKGIASAVMPKKQTEYAARASRQMAVKSARTAGEAARSARKTVRIAAKGLCSCDPEIRTAIRHPRLCTGHTGYYDAGIQGAGQ